MTFGAVAAAIVPIGATEHRDALVARCPTGPWKRNEPRLSGARQAFCTAAVRLSGYFAVFALFCFGFFGVLAFLSTSSLLTFGPPRPSTGRS